MKSFNEYLTPKLSKLDLPSYTIGMPLDLLEGMGETTQNASVTELFPCLAFNKKFRPSSVEDFKKFLYKLNIKSAKSS